MVRHRMRSHKGGDRGCSSRSQAARNEAPPPPPASPPPSQTSSLPPSPHRRHYPHSAFHSNNFRFQSNLNRPIISANVTIIFFEEESHLSALARFSVDQTQNIHRMEFCSGPKQPPMDEGGVAYRVNLNVDGDAGGYTRRPSGSARGATISFAFVGSSSGTPLVTGIPGGNAPDAIVGCSSDLPLVTGPLAGKADGDAAIEGVVWYGNECLVVEEDFPM